MDYRENLIEAINRYYSRVIEPYKATTMAALKDAKKMGLFKKRDFSGHIAGFAKHAEDAKEIDVSWLDIPSDDVQSKMLLDKFVTSINSFVHLCEVNMDFYRLCDCKQHRDSGVDMDEYKRGFNMTQLALGDSVTELGDLDKAFRAYTGADEGQKQPTQDEKH